MDMAAKFQDQTVFHLTGKRAGDGLAPSSTAAACAPRCSPRTATCPAALRLPVVLLARDDGAQYACSRCRGRSATLLDAVAPRGIDGERLRTQRAAARARDPRADRRGRHGHALRAVAAGRGTRGRGRRRDVGEMLARAVESLDVDGELVDCDRQPAAALRDAVRGATCRPRRRAVPQPRRPRWCASCRTSCAPPSSTSQAGQQPHACSAAFGALHDDMFDFEAMSRLVGRKAPKDELPAARRHRIERTLAVLRGAAFYGADPKSPASTQSYDFAFDNCAAAVEAYRARLPQLVELVKAIASRRARGRAAATSRPTTTRSSSATTRHSLTRRRPRTLPGLPGLHPAGAQRRAARTRR